MDWLGIPLGTWDDFVRSITKLYFVLGVGVAATLVLTFPAHLVAIWLDNHFYSYEDVGADELFGDFKAEVFE